MASGEYHNDDTERLRDVLKQLSQARTQPQHDHFVRQLPTALLDAPPVRLKQDRSTTAPQENTLSETATSPSNLAEQLAHTLCDPNQPEVFHAFQVVELVNAHLVEDMNDLLHTGHKVVRAQAQQPHDAQRRLKQNLVTLLSSAHLWWLSHQLHSLIMPAHYSQRLHALYGARVALELAKDLIKGWWPAAAR